MKFTSASRSSNSQASDGASSLQTIDSVGTRSASSQGNCNMGDTNIYNIHIKEMPEKEEKIKISSGKE